MAPAHKSPYYQLQASTSPGPPKRPLLASSEPLFMTLPEQVRFLILSKKKYIKRLAVVKLLFVSLYKVLDIII